MVGRGRVRGVDLADRRTVFDVLTQLVSNADRFVSNFERFAAALRS